MSSKPPPAFPPPGTLKAKLVNLIPRTNVVVYRWSKGVWRIAREPIDQLARAFRHDNGGRPAWRPPSLPAVF
jgi:hypothetical protein